MGSNGNGKRSTRAQQALVSLVPHLLEADELVARMLEFLECRRTGSVTFHISQGKIMTGDIRETFRGRAPEEIG